MGARAGVSVIVRARDEAGALVGCLDALAAQVRVAPVQIIYVDLGSHDDSREIARTRGATVVVLESFSFGAALNLGAQAAEQPVIAALSAHAGLPDHGWLARACATLADPGVACTSGDTYGPDGEPLIAAVRQGVALARRRPEWGYANGAGAFQADLWRERPFREDLPACEDKEWARYWLEHGYHCVIDPDLAVAHDHTHDPLRAIYARARREATAYAMFAGRGPQTLRGLAHDWWSDTRFYSEPWRARLSPRRTARLLGDHAGRRQP